MCVCLGGEGVFNKHVQGHSTVVCVRMQTVSGVRVFVLCVLYVCAKHLCAALSAVRQ